MELLDRAILEATIDQAPDIVRRRALLSDRIARFRPRWRGRRVGRAVVRREVRQNPDRAARERAFRAEEELYRPMEPELRELVVARNEAARAAGYRSYPEYRLSFEGWSVGRLQSLIDTAVRSTPAEMKRRRDRFAARTGESGWFPWDLARADETEASLPDRVFPGRGMFARVADAVGRWGFPPRTLRFRLTRHDLSAGGLTLAPDPPKDVRIVVHPIGGWRSYTTLFHEVGHAVNSASVRQPSHLLRWHENLPGFAGIAEGEGRFFEQIASCPEWLATRPGLSRPGVIAATAVVRRAPLASVATLGAWIRTELALYLEPHRDPTDVAHRFRRAVFGFDSYAPVPFADAFSVRAPVYAPSYLFAELLRPCLTAAALRDVGGELWPNRRIGPWLVEHWFRDGSSYDWTDRLRAVTGGPLDARAFNAEMRALAA